MSKVTILGINGHIGHHAAEAFAAAGWDVTGFGRSNKHPIAGVAFVKGDARASRTCGAAIGDTDVVVNALNLPYHQWDKGRMEAQTRASSRRWARAARRMLFPGNIYNYAASDRVRDARTCRSARRRRAARSACASRRCSKPRPRARRHSRPSSCAPATSTARTCAATGSTRPCCARPARARSRIMGEPGVGHTWAYLPDLGRAFEKLAWHRKELGAFETFHFAGTYVTPEQMADAIVDGRAGAAQGRPLPVDHPSG